MVEPKDAASLILLSEDRTKVLWARRNPALTFMGGFHSFTGGRLDPDDEHCDVRNEAEPLRKALIACAVRETFEEAGVLIVRNGEKLTQGQRRSLHDDLVSGRDPFSRILELWGLWIDANDFAYAGEWTTPEFSPIRFRTRFFIATMPPRQTAYEAIDELQSFEFVSPSIARQNWRRSRVLMAPPAQFSMAALEANSNPIISLEKAARDLVEWSELLDGSLFHIDLNDRITCIPLRTKTLPPATHTNCFIVGGKRFVVIDPASRDESEQAKLIALLEMKMEQGGRCEAIVISHLHADHFGGEAALKRYFLEEHGTEVPVVAHESTRDSLEGRASFDEAIPDDHTYMLQDKDGAEFSLRVLHTPGHARGHLCFYDPEYGFLLSMDNVLGFGSVLIDPPEGNMTDYLDSLERMRSLPGLRSLCGSHGMAVSDAKGKIGEYIAHRMEREEQVAEALAKGVTDAADIARELYTDLDPALMPLAVRSVTAHLERLQEVA